MNEAKEKRPVKLRRRYQSADGQSVPGVTTVTGLLNKPSLVRWANKLGLEGVEVSARTEQSARIGTLVHAMIQAELLGRDFDPVGEDPAELEQAQQALSLFHAWREQHSLRPIHCETSFVSERLRFGGTVDCYCILDGRPVLLDFKTGRSIYDEYFVQLAAYARLLREQGYPVEEVRVLRLGREGGGQAEERAVSDTEKWFAVFQALLQVYYLKKDLNWHS